MKSLLIKDTTKEELVVLLRQEYEVDEETAANAVDSIVEKFASVELIKE